MAANKSAFLQRSLVAAVCLLAAASHLRAEELDVCAVLGLTGYASVHSANMLSGLELAKADLESQGSKVKLTVEDDGTVAARSVSAVQSLLSKGCRLFIGPAWSFQVEAAAPLYEQHDVIAFLPSAYTAVAGGPHPHLFHGTAPAEKKTAPLSAWLKSRSTRRVAIVYAASAWGETHRQVYEAAARSAGAAVVFTGSFEYGQEQSAIGPMVIKALAQSPDALLTTSSDQGAALFVKKLQELHARAAFLSTDDIVDALSQGLIKPAGGAPELYTVTLAVSPAFREHYFSRLHREPGVYAETAYAGMMLLAEAKAHAGPAPHAMREYLQHDPGFDNNGDTTRGEYTVHRLEFR